MNIYYEVHGNGYPIILLHGNQENRKIYDNSKGIGDKKTFCD